MIFNTPDTLVKYIRDGLVEEQHFGYVLVINRIHVIDRVGESGNYPFYLRSCAKPLQASLIIDFGMDKEYQMTDEEIALCCASHSGEECHINTAKGLMNKIGIDESYLKCGIHEPLSPSARNRMLINNEKPTPLHNNCSGKHIMMIGLAKLKGWSLDDYDKPNHPLQQEIKNKIYDLCELKKEYPVTTDGCGVPIYSMPLQNMAKGFLNMLCSDKYERIKNAVLKNPYIFGGENRTDTKIIENSEGLIAKVGAGGLCVVVNTNTEEAMAVKISDCDMKAREIVVLDAMRNLHWADIKVDYDIKTIHGDVVGQIVTTL